MRRSLKASPTVTVSSKFCMMLSEQTCVTSTGGAPGGLCLGFEWLQYGPTGLMSG